VSYPKIHLNLIFLKKKVDKRVSLCCTVGYKWVTLMDGVKFEFNDIIISLFTKNDSDEDGDILLQQYYCLVYLMI